MLRRRPDAPHLAFRAQRRRGELLDHEPRVSPESCAGGGSPESTGSPAAPRGARCSPAVARRRWPTVERLRDRVAVEVPAAHHLSPGTSSWPCPQPKDERVVRRGVSTRWKITSRTKRSASAPPRAPEGRSGAIRGPAPLSQPGPGGLARFLAWAMERRRSSAATSIWPRCPTNAVDGGEGMERACEPSVPRPSWRRAPRRSAGLLGLERASAPDRFHQPGCRLTSARPSLAYSTQAPARRGAAFSHRPAAPRAEDASHLRSEKVRGPGEHQVRSRPPRHYREPKGGMTSRSSQRDEEVPAFALADAAVDPPAARSRGEQLNAGTDLRGQRLAHAGSVREDKIAAGSCADSVRAIAPRPAPGCRTRCDAAEWERASAIRSTSRREAAPLARAREISTRAPPAAVPARTCSSCASSVDDDCARAAFFIVRCAESPTLRADAGRDERRGGGGRPCLLRGGARGRQRSPSHLARPPGRVTRGDRGKQKPC